MKYRIYRHLEGIGLNGKEFVLDDEGEVMLFATVDNAVELVANDILDHFGDEVSREELEDDYGIHIEENV
jgi:hypothetical protein|tara:strand:+ start:537 stop:746 length:210 start_codon:yes stop_codon:yes gene_type:complete